METLPRKKNKYFKIDDVCSFILKKGIQCKYFGNKKIKILGLSNIEDPTPNTIFYSDNIESKYCLEDSILISNKKNSNSNYIFCKNPKLAFYILSEYFYKKNIISVSKKSKIPEDCIVGVNSIIGDCKIGNNVIIGNNTVIEDGVSIGDNTVIGNNCSIGCFGVSWTWKKNKKVFLYAIGRTIIGNDCKISSNVKIVRGVFTKDTLLGDEVFIAPGSAIGHGSTIKNGVHIANNCSIGGSAVIRENCFLGSSSTVSTHAVVGSGTIISSSCCVISDQTLEEDSVYVGTPARKIKNISNKYSLNGVPSKSAGGKFL